MENANFPPFGVREDPFLFNMKDKKIIEGHLINNGEIQFTNYLNKVIRTVEVERVLERWREEIEEMALPNVSRYIVGIIKSIFIIILFLS